MESQLSKEEAKNFLEITCGVNDPFRKYSLDKKNLLPEILSAFLHTIPFQNLTLLSKNKEDRRAPTEKEIKQDVFSKRVGMCFTVNNFLHALLEAIGYDVDIAMAMVGGDESADHGNHIVVLVRNLSADSSIHVVDVGVGFPHFEPVLLEEGSNIRIQKQSFNTHGYIKEDNKYKRLHLRSSGDVCGQVHLSH